MNYHIFILFGYKLILDSGKFGKLVYFIQGLLLTFTLNIAQRIADCILTWSLSDLFIEKNSKHLKRLVSILNSSMENLSNRLPHLISNILNKINDQSLFYCKESSRKMNNFIVSEKFFWLRIIQKYRGNFVEFNESWNKTIKKSSIDFLMKLSQATYRFFTKRSSRFESQWHPLFIVGDR